MSGQRPDVSRLFEHFGLDPREYLHFPEQPQFATALAVAVSRGGSSGVPARRVDPYVRSALLRARLLEGESP
jgi:hypothetical protein